MLPPRSAAAIPADSWPRCCSAYSAKYDSRETSCPGAYMPNTPHSSRGPSRSSGRGLAAVIGSPSRSRRMCVRLTASRRSTANSSASGIPCAIARPVSAERQLHDAPSPPIRAATRTLTSPTTRAPSARSACSSPLTTKPPEPSPNSAARGRGRESAPVRSRARRTEQPSSKRLHLERHARAELAGQAALRQRDRQAALGDVVGARERAGAHRLADGRLRAATASMSIAGRPSGSSRPTASPARSPPATARRDRRARSRRPRARKPSRPARRTSGSSPTMPITGVG